MVIIEGYDHLPAGKVWVGESTTSPTTDRVVFHRSKMSSVEPGYGTGVYQNGTW
ncbi:hypothetical protein [Propionicimonas sp.]|uniref:hypothetical protein n=1 Tax=Propionicimonas sp. TaxID=1955623 RepID=UPI0039E5D60B